MKCKSACLSVCLLMFVTACTGQRPTTPRIETERITPPDALLEDCPAPARPGPTIGDALDYIPRVRRALEACNLDKAALREWKRGAAPDDGARADAR